MALPIDDELLDPPSPEMVKKSACSEKVEQIRKVTIEAAARHGDAKNGKLPQPLFWSLFHSQIKEIRKEKEATRVIKALMGSVVK